MVLLSRRKSVVNGIDYLADTNAIIYLLAGNSCMNSFKDAAIAVSVISEMELLSFPRITEQEVCVIKDLLSHCTIFPLDNEIKNQAIHLRRSLGLKLPDAIVAATAMAKSLSLITADKAFARLPDLNIDLLEP